MNKQKDSAVIEILERDIISRCQEMLDISAGTQDVSLGIKIRNEKRDLEIAANALRCSREFEFQNGTLAPAKVGRYDQMMYYNTGVINGSLDSVDKYVFIQEFLVKGIVALRKRLKFLAGCNKREQKKLNKVLKRCDKNAKKALQRCNAVDSKSFLVSEKKSKFAFLVTGFVLANLVYMAPPVYDAIMNMLQG